MSDERLYYNYKNCIMPVQPTMTVCQLVGQNQAQESLDIYIRVPRGKPSMEQVVDVYVKKIKITSIDVVCDKVIVRGKFEVKVLYVACKPSQPVHAVEMHNVRFTVPVDIRGVRSGMDAEATVRAEFVDYDCDPHTRAGWYQRKAKWDKENCWEDEEEKPCKPDWDDCHMPKKCTRRCHVSVVLQVIAKVFTTRDILVYQGGGLPVKPKG